MDVALDKYDNRATEGSRGKGGEGCISCEKVARGVAFSATRRHFPTARLGETLPLDRLFSRSLDQSEELGDADRRTILIRSERARLARRVPSRKAVTARARAFPRQRRALFRSGKKHGMTLPRFKRGRLDMQRNGCIRGKPPEGSERSEVP